MTRMPVLSVEYYITYFMTYIFNIIMLIDYF